MIQRTTVWVFVGVFAIATPRIAAADIITWDFTGSIGRIDTDPKPGPSFGDLYPVGTPLTYSLTFDTASPSARCPGYYPTAVISSSLTLGTDTFSGARGVSQRAGLPFNRASSPSDRNFLRTALTEVPLCLGRSGCCLTIPSLVRPALSPPRSPRAPGSSFTRRSISLPIGTQVQA
jgi:hypothetical protein